MGKNVVAVVGQNLNGILECQSRRFNALLEQAGFSGHVLDLAHPEFGARLAGLIEDGIAFAWGYAGVGARLAVDGQLLWDRLNVPFISVLADAPFIMPPNHHVASGWVVNGYIYREWLDFQRQHIRSPQVAGLLPMGVIPNAQRDAVPWSRREMRMVFVKTGDDPARLRTLWAGWPARLQRVLEDSADALTTRGTGSIVPVVEACLTAHGLLLDDGNPMLFGLLHELDTYVRAVRATAMARAVQHLPVDVIGGGWEHVAAQGGQARFHPPIAAAELETLYARTQILLNATPNFRSGAHERVLRGFAARCCVVSDDNDFSRERLCGLPSYHGLEWNDPDLADRLAAIFHDPARFDDRTDTALDYVEREHDPALFLNGMAELAHVARLTPTMACYALDAA